MTPAKPKIALFPGASCDHYRAGRCLYEERLNPGLDVSLRCVAMLACEAAFDGFLAQADNFDLSDGRTVAIWEQRFEKLAAKNPDCELFAPAPGQDFPRCAHFDGELCLMRLPVCPGVCRNYARTEKNR
jgi:hypothetical protein